MSQSVATSSMVDSAPLAASGISRSPGVRICPVCRKQFGRSRTKTIEQCPRDQIALIDEQAFFESGEDPLLGHTIAGRYVILAKLGAGAMGAVYRARQEPMGRDVAIKILRSDKIFDTSAKGRFEREARATSMLTSPYTVTVHDFGEAEDGSLFLAMELLDGESIGTRLRRIGKLPPATAVGIAREALTSLAEAHDKGIIHRDIKPDNLFLARVQAPDGRGVVERCKVVDFGIAKLIRGDAAMDGLETQAGTVFGTPRYMSPEQAQGKTLDARSDLYSLSTILYQMISGRPPFIDDDAVIVMAHHIKTPPPPLREIAPDVEIPLSLEKVIHQALSKDPSRRPGSATQFRLLLEEAMEGYDLEGTSIRSSVERSVITLSAPLRKHPRRTAALFAGAVVLLLLSVWGLRAHSLESKSPTEGVGNPSLSISVESIPLPPPSAAPVESASSAPSAPVTPSASAEKKHASSSGHSWPWRPSTTPVRPSKGNYGKLDP